MVSAPYFRAKGDFGLSGESQSFDGRLLEGKDGTGWGATPVVGVVVAVFGSLGWLQGG